MERLVQAIEGLEVQAPVQEERNGFQIPGAPLVRLSATNRSRSERGPGLESWLSMTASQTSLGSGNATEGNEENKEQSTLFVLFVSFCSNSGRTRRSRICRTTRITDPAPITPELVPQRNRGVRWIRWFDFPQPTVRAPNADPGSNPEIGRASCRERV